MCVCMYIYMCTLYIYIYKRNMFSSVHAFKVNKQIHNICWRLEWPPRTRLLERRH